MRGVVYDGFGPAEVLRLAEVPRPEIRPHDLLVRVKAAGVNRADILQRNGAYGNQSFGESTLLGLELAGEVAGVGSEVDDVSIGQRVMAIVGMPNSPGSTVAWRSGFPATSRSSRARRSWNHSSRPSNRFHMLQASGKVKPS